MKVVTAIMMKRVSPIVIIYRHHWGLSVCLRKRTFFETGCGRNWPRSFSRCGGLLPARVMPADRRRESAGRGVAQLAVEEMIAERLADQKAAHRTFAVNLRQRSRLRSSRRSRRATPPRRVALFRPQSRGGESATVPLA